MPASSITAGGKTNGGKAKTMSDTPKTRQLEECDQYKVDEDYAEYNAYRRIVEHAQQMEMQRDEARGIVLACHRAFIGGSDFCQHEARRLSADLVRKISPPNAEVSHGDRECQPAADQSSEQP